MRDLASTYDLHAGVFETAIEKIYLAATEPTRWPTALQSIADCFGDVGANLVYERDDGNLATIVSPGLEIAQRDYAAGWWQQDIRFSRLVERGYLLTSDAFTDRHVASEEEIESHPFYVGFLASHGLKWVTATSISPERNLNAILAMQRASARPPFSDQELALFARLGHHVENALRLGIRLLSAEVTKLALGDALARLEVGVFMLDAAGRVVFSNPAGDALIGNGLQISGGVLGAHEPTEREALRGAIQLAAGANLGSAEAPKPIVVRGLTSDHFLVVRVLPVRLPDRSQRLFLGARAMVMAASSRAGEPPDPAFIRDVLGLALGEARVAALIGSGLAPREVAERLGITEETARTTLKRVFAKAGVSRQSELAALLARLTLG